MVNLYEGSWVRALLHLYPEIGMDKFLFKSLPRMSPRHRFVKLTHITKLGSHWLKKENRREFFDRFAVSNSLDPLNPSTWPPISKDKLLKFKVNLLLIIIRLMIILIIIVGKY